MAVAIVEREIRHSWIPFPGSLQKRGLRGLGASQDVGGFGAPGGNRRAVERLVPIEEVGESIGEAAVVVQRGVVIARRGDEGNGSQKRRADGRGRLVGIVCRIELARGIR